MRIFLLYLCFVVCSVSWSQEGGEAIIDGDSIDHKLMSRLMFDKVNEVRLEQKLAKIVVSDSLAAKAQVHSAKMLKEDKITYSSLTTKVGECNGWTEVPYGILNYNDVVEFFVNRWLDSPGHKDLLLGEFFVYGGCGMSFEATKGGFSIYACFMISYFP